MMKHTVKAGLRVAALSMAITCLAAVGVSAAETGTITGGTINVRKGPGTDHERITMVNTGKQVNILGSENGWYHISWNGNEGYVCGDYLTVNESSEEAEVETLGGTVTGGTINVRTGPGTDNDRITKVTTGQKVSIIGEEDGWYQVSFGGTVGYILNDYVYEGDSLPASSVGEQVAAMAKSYLGVPYVYGGASPSGFDCSGLTMYLYRQFGYSLPHTASGQYANCGYKVSKSELQPGDLVFFSSNGGSRITHVGVYVGGGQVVHARLSVGRVYTNSLSESYYSRNYVGAVRIA